MLGSIGRGLFYEISILATVSDNLVDELKSSKLLVCLIVWAGTKGLQTNNYGTGLLITRGPR